MNITPFPKISTNRLLLRKINEIDAESILFLRSDKIVNQFIQRPPERQINTLDKALAHINKLNTLTENNQSITWGITLKNNPNIIGTICLWNFSNNNTVVEVGYDLHPDYHRKGIMSEALKSVIQFSFEELKFQKIEAYTHLKNESSKMLLERNGFNLVENKYDEDNSSNIIFEIINPKQKPNK
ncbi:GNAT family N-acetyltransferase [Pseudofulvibacter geojedonensis]|uniref:GNAT family N-acetyltransferase n=1 Tax=Pseudofulvibacter geojedonensis TaxID=1123758 RepID=A0ABW3I3X2_9FLAO